jgi:putative ABC transport system permease protein
LSVSVKPRDLWISQAKEEATSRCTARRLCRNSRTTGIFTSDTILDITRHANGILQRSSVPGPSPVVGGIDHEIMLMVVTERTRRSPAQGASARRSDIVAQMLTESVVLSIFGGVIGTMVGAAIAMTIARFTPIPASVELWSVGLGITITALVGLFFGIYPAMRAARLDPIEALRKE